MSPIHLRCPLCGLLTVREATDMTPFQCQNETCGEDGAAGATEHAALTLRQIAQAHVDRMGAGFYLDPRTTAWVYYVRFGNRIKIGTTINLKRRLSALPFDEVLAIEPGSNIVERERHLQFAVYRVPGQREWFQIAADLLNHAEDIRAKHGDPAAILAAQQ